VIAILRNANSRSQVHFNTVFIEYSWFQKISIKNGKILLLDINFNDKLVREASSSREMPSMQTKYSKFAEIIVIMDVKVVLGQRSLPRGLQKALKLKGITYFDRLSAKQASKECLWYFHHHNFF
jgi:hypothetical protein